MWARLILLILLATAAVVVIQHWRGPKLLRVPFLWRSLSRRHSDLATALSVRTAIGRMLMSRSSARAESVIREVDRVIAALVLLARTRESRGVTDAAPDDASRDALAELESLHSQLVDEASDQTADVLDQVRERLAAKTDELRESTQVRSELGD